MEEERASGRIRTREGGRARHGTRGWPARGVDGLCAVAGWAQLAVARSSMQGRAARGTRMAGGGADMRHAAMCTTASSPAQNFGAVTEAIHMLLARGTHVHRWKASVLIEIQARRATSSSMQSHARTHMHVEDTLR